MILNAISEPLSWSLPQFLILIWQICLLSSFNIINWPRSFFIVMRSFVPLVFCRPSHKLGAMRSFPLVFCRPSRMLGALRSFVPLLVSCLCCHSLNVKPGISASTESLKIASMSEVGVAAFGAWRRCLASPLGPGVEALSPLGPGVGGTRGPPSVGVPKKTGSENLETTSAAFSFVAIWP